MNINEAEKRTGITKKAIRFYEEAGLLSIRREEESGYRYFAEEDITLLKKIKLYRNIGLPVQEIHDILLNELTLQDALLVRKQELDSQIQQLQREKELLQSLLDSSRLTSGSAELIYDIEDILFSNNPEIWDKLIRIEQRDLVLASLGASPQFNNFLQEHLPELNLKAEQAKVGRVQIKVIEDAQLRIILQLNRQEE